MVIVDGTDHAALAVTTTLASNETPSTPTAEPLSREALFRLVGPLVGVVMATILAEVSEHAGLFASGPVIAAALLTAATVAVTAFAPWQLLPRSMGVLPPIAFVVVAILIRQAPGGDPGYDLLVLLPVVWVGFFGTRRELLAVLAAVVAVRVGVALIPGASDGWATRSLFVVATAAFLGLVIQQVFGQMRLQTSALRTEARRDHLTTVANRLAWEEEVRLALRSSTRTGEPLCVAVLDLDHFKEFNDRTGHPEGDRLLRDITQAWTGQLRASDLLARLGGDEFAVLLRGCASDSAAAVAGRLCRSIPGEVTCSAGVATWDGSEQPDALLARADAALYRAKARGRDRVEIAGSPDTVISLLQ